jgi:uroporphyrinogen decarboxylase
MNSRERLLTSLNHKEPDRVPIDFSGTTVSGICWQAYDELRKLIGLQPTRQSIFDLGGAAVMGFALPDEKVIERMHSDTIMVNLGDPDTYATIFEHADRYDTYIDQWGTKLFHPTDGHYFDFREFPIQKGDLTEFYKYDAWPNPVDDGRFRGLRDNCLDALKKERVLMVCPLYGGGVFEQPARIMPMVEWFTGIGYDPKFSEVVLGKMFELYYQTTVRMLEEIGDLLDIYVYWDDLSGQDRPMVSIDWYRKFVHPLYKKLFGKVHSMTDAKIFFHCCGSARPFIPYLIDAGVDIINPVQISAVGMEPNGLKRDFGNDVVFWGGACDCQSVLPFGTKQEVIDQTRKNIDALAPGGGFVFANIHNIQNLIPAENILAMYDTCYEYGVY